MAAPCRGAVTAPTAVFLVFTGFLLISKDTFGGRHLRPLESTATATRLTHSPRILRTSTQIFPRYIRSGEIILQNPRQRQCGATVSEASASTTPARLPALGLTAQELVNHDLKSLDASAAEGAGEVVKAIEGACVKIARALARVNIDKLTGDEGGINIQGERQKKLDVYANDLLKEALFDTGLVASIATEEEDDVVMAPIPPTAPVTFSVAFDPLDGSSNIDCSVPTGTIFSIYKLQETNFAEKVFYSPVKDILVSGYAMYSSATSLVLTAGQGTHMLSLDPDRGSFLLTNPSLNVPERGPYYSLNEGRFFDWPEGLKKYINDMKQGKGAWGKQYSSRYVCSLVADVHRTLLYGGWAGNPRPHLRLLFEAAPLSFIVQQAGGEGSDGEKRIMSYHPTALHQRLPVFIGSSLDIEELESYGDVQQGAARYEA
ncbi:hypothetical protein AAMO2058_000497500 [Amorphochlora amoebiformis]